MRQFKLKSPDGRSFTLNAPDDATDDQIKTKVQEIQTNWTKDGGTIKPESFQDKAVGLAKKMYQQSAPLQSALSSIADAGMDVFEKGGDVLTETLSTGAPNRVALPPKAAATIGLTAKMLPYAAGVMEGAAPIARRLAGEIAAGGLTAPIKSLGTSAVETSTKGWQAIRENTRKAVQSMTQSDLKQSIKNMEQRLVRYQKDSPDAFRIKASESIKDQAREGLDLVKEWEGKLAKETGYKFKGAGKVDSKLVAKFKEIDQFTPEQLSGRLSPSQLQDLYDRGKQLSRTVDVLDTPFVTKVMRNITEAQDITRPGIKKGRELLAESYKARKELPDLLRQQKVASRAQVLETKLQLQELKAALKKPGLLKRAAKSRLGKAALAGAVGAMGAGAGWKLFH